MLRLFTGSEPVPMSRVQAGCSPVRAIPGIEEVPAPTVGPAGPPDLHTYRPPAPSRRMPPLPWSNAQGQMRNDRQPTRPTRCPSNKPLSSSPKSHQHIPVLPDRTRRQKSPLPTSLCSLCGDPKNNKTKAPQRGARTGKTSRVSACKQARSGVETTPEPHTRPWGHEWKRPTR